jgi:hypothetical protein
MSQTSVMKRRNFFLPEKVWEQLQERAKARQVPVSEVLRQLLVEALKLNEPAGQ